MTWRGISARPYGSEAAARDFAARNAGAASAAAAAAAATAADEGDKRGASAASAAAAAALKPVSRQKGAPNTDDPAAPALLATLCGRAEHELLATSYDAS